MAGGVRPDSSMGILLSTEERMEVLVRIGGRGGGPAEEKRRQRWQGGVPLPAAGVPQPAACQCWKEQDKAADTQAAVPSVSLPRQ